MRGCGAAKGVKSNRFSTNKFSRPCLRAICRQRDGAVAAEESGGRALEGAEEEGGGASGDGEEKRRMGREGTGMCVSVTAGRSGDKVGKGRETIEACEDRRGAKYRLTYTRVSLDPIHEDRRTPRNSFEEAPAARLCVRACVRGASCTNSKSKVRSWTPAETERVEGREQGKTNTTLAINEIDQC